MEKAPYKWKIADGYPMKGVEYNGLKVYSTFSCGWGSTMGYKLAGYDVIGANDIDPQMMKLYTANHHPKRYDLCPVGELLTKELPPEMFELDILDGSPPCSTFSMAWDREEAFGKNKVFREWQAKQVLSDLFFDWIDLVDRLRPKVAIAENVKGMLIWNAKGYTKTVLKRLEEIGYTAQLFLLNGASIGLPQRRERVFFICTRKDLNLPKISLNFNEKPVNYSEIDEWDVERKKVQPCDLELWKKIKPGESCSKAHPKGSRFNSIKLDPNAPVNTISASGGCCLYHHKYPGFITDREMILAGSFPLDYDFCWMKPQYCVGMSVPPLMMARVADEVRKQIFKL